VAVAGSHGKTTTTSMCAAVLGNSKLDPTVVVGGVVKTFGSTARMGRSDLIVVEADESDRSFLMLTPTIAIVTNIDREHMDYYRDMDDVRKCFVDFVNKVPFYGAVVLCIDDPNVQAIIPHVKRRRITYGLAAQADISAHDINFETGYGSRFTVLQGSETLGEINLPVPGKHNIYNALAAVAVGLEFGLPFPQIAEAFNSFTNADRRFQVKGKVNDITVVDDYGHHPTEIRATLNAAKAGAEGQRLVVLFQPHRYTRTQDLMEEFARSFNNADVLYLLDIYAASEDPLPGVTAEVLAEKIKKFGHKNVHYIGALENGPKVLAEQAQPGDLVITLGAGTVYRAGEQLLEMLREKGS
jgi:UDP-N-acetylmuramate--alanine ligase